MLIVIAALFTISQSANAQNYTREVSMQVFNSTIVRSINENDRVVYVENSKNNERVFLYYNDQLANPYLIGIRLPQFKNCDYYVNDYVIYDKDIYFCGYKRDVTSGDSTGIFGRVDTAGLNNISYCDVPGTINMRKIAVFEDAGKPHVVMVGDENKKTTILVEATVASASVWNITMSSSSPIENNYYDDLTVTDSHIVVVSRHRTGSGNAYIHLFDRPTTYLPILYSIASYFKTEYTVSGPIMVEHRAGSEYATVARTIGHEGYFFSCYDKTNHLGSSIFLLQETLNSCTLYDIRYNRLTKKTDVLTKNTRQGNTLYEIIHHLVSGMAVISSRYTTENAIRSLDYIENTGNMVASGFSLTDNNLLLYKYQPEIYTCFTMRMPHGNIVSNHYEPLEEDLKGLFFKQECVNIEPDLVIYRISTLCE